MKSKTREHFRYKAEFSSVAKCATSADKDSFLAIASLEPIKPLLPQNIDFNRNYDLLPFAANGAVVNRANLNNHVMDSTTAIACYKDFIYKPMDLEHNRSLIVGVILTAGFTEYGTNKILTEDQVKGMTDPFNMSVGGLVYKINNPTFADSLEDSANPESPFYESISLSWEVGYNDFYIAVGSPNLSEAEIVKDEVHIKELSPFLRSNGGQNKLPDGTPIFMQIYGEDVLGFAYGFTSRPAANVKGVVTANNTEKDKNKENNIEIISQQQTSNVKDNSMKKQLKSFQDIASITDDNVIEFSVASINEVITKEIARISEEWSSKLKDKETAASDAKASVEKLSQTVDNLQSQLNTVLAEQARVEAEAVFNSHMTLLDSEFELSDEDRSVITEQIKNLDEASFEKWYSSFARFATDKKKKVAKTDKTGKPDVKEDKMDKKGGESCASTEVTEEEIQKRIDAATATAVEAALKNAKEQGTIPVNNATVVFGDMREQYKNAFKQDGLVVAAK